MMANVVESIGNQAIPKLPTIPMGVTERSGRIEPDRADSHMGVAIAHIT